MSKQSDLVNIAQGDTITVDHANGKVGIGTSSPSFPMHVSTSTFPGVGIFRALDVGTIGAASQEIQIGALDGSTPTPGASIIGVLNTPATTGTLSFQTRSGGALSERMRIDSAGNVTKPYQPMFLGFPTNDYSGGSMPTGVMSITAYYNNGGHFNAANSRFTAPVAGWYQTTWGGLQLPNTVTSIMVNGTRFINGNHGVYTGSYISMTQTAIRYLNAGDYLNIEQWNGGGYFSSWYVWSVTLLG